MVMSTSQSATNAMNNNPLVMTTATIISNGHHGTSVRRATVDMALSRRLLEAFRPKHTPAPKRISDETCDALGEVIRMLVTEAHSRATIEAECDAEGDDIGDDDISSSSKNNDENQQQQKTNQTREASKDTKKISKPAPILAKHITKIAAELLMDFS
jgi:hypothetical protein